MERPKKLTKKSGVYLFKDEQDHVIYIGKAKNIATRVASYFNNRHDPKVSMLLEHAVSLETIPTNSEQEALYLEVDLIKKYQPKFNQLLKEGNPFIYLFFSNEIIPTLSIVRMQEKKKKGLYVGPFLSKKAARAVFDFLISTFQLKLCKKKIEHGCLQFHIGVCAGACQKNFDLEFYKFRLKLAQYLVSQEPEKFLKDIDQQLKEAMKTLQFEKAKHLLEYKKNFEQFAYTLEKLSAMPSKQKNPDKDKNLPLLLALQKRLNLKHIPYVIDCFDISHLQGRFIVGSCIRYVHAQPEPNAFRRFKIQSLVDQNDYAALQEIVSRRYKSGYEYPNLVIVDGGKGQINAIKKLIGDAELVGLAKREETIISADFSTAIKLDVHRSEDALILQIRDKTHQFAISYHRKKRAVN